MTTLQDPTENAIGPPVEADICGDHHYGAWREYLDKRTPTRRLFGRGVMMDADLSSVEVDYGCGGFYQGHAQGSLYAQATVKPEVAAQARPLRYDSIDGFFYDAVTCIRLSHVSMLILQPDLHATYIP